MLQSPFGARQKVLLCQVVGEVATWGLGVNKNQETTPCRARLGSAWGRATKDLTCCGRQGRGFTGPWGTEGVGEVLWRCTKGMARSYGTAPMPQPPEGLSTAWPEGTGKGQRSAPMRTSFRAILGAYRVCSSVTNNWNLEIKAFFVCFCFLRNLYSLDAGTMRQLKLS